MKGSDKIEMTINIGGEHLKISVSPEDQTTVRETILSLNRHCAKLKKNWPDCNDRQILAMAAYQFAFWHRELQIIQEKAQNLTEKAMTALTVD